MKTILDVKNISKKYQSDNGEIESIKNISFSVKEGEFISVVGPSGSGKSTLLSIIAGIIKPSNGEVYIYNNKVNGISNYIGYMLQKDNLLDFKTVYKNVILGLEIKNLINKENLDYVDKLLKNYGLYEFKDKLPSQLSGGMRQRVALIRTLAIKPDILLLDEAFSALDYQTRLSVTDDVYKIIKNENKTTIMITHDIPESISMSDRIIVLSNRPAIVKSIHKIDFTSNIKLPTLKRNNEHFYEYFNNIWKELDIHV